MTSTPLRGGLAWAILGLASVLCFAGLVLAFTGPNAGPGIEEIAIEDVIDTVCFLAFALVGALLVSQRGNSLGWIFCAIGLFFQLGLFMDELSTRLFVEQGPSVGARLAGLWPSATFLLPLALATIFLPLYFPSGRLASVRWRPVALIAAAVLALNVISTALLPGPLDEDRPALTNPAGMEGAAGAMSLLVGSSVALLAVLAVVSVVSLIVRGFRSHGEERRPFGLLAIGVAVLVIVFGLDGLLQPMVPGWGPVSAIVAILAIPTATYLALLKLDVVRQEPPEMIERRV